MILYNFRHRGAYEYDKFILNIFQFHNEVVMLHGKIFKEGATDRDNLIKMKESFDNYFDNATGSHSMSGNIYNQMLWLD